MHIAVIGRSGQLARAFARRADTRDTCVLMGRDTCDLADPATIRPALKAARPDLIVNAAAHTAVDRAEEEPELAHAINATGPGEAARVAAEMGVPFLHISTDYVFDGTKAGPYVETDPVAPLGVYGTSKRAGEEAVLAAGPRMAVFRTAWVHDAGNGNFPATILRLADRDELRVVHDQIGSPTYADDLADFLLIAAARCVEAPSGAPCFDVFHAAGAGSASWAEFAEAILSRAAALGLIDAAPPVRRITTAEYPTPAARPANSVLDCARARAVFGTAPRDWSEGLDAMLAARAKGEDAR